MIGLIIVHIVVALVISVFCILACQQSWNTGYLVGHIDAMLEYQKDNAEKE